MCRSVTNDYTINITLSKIVWILYSHFSGFGKKTMTGLTLCLVGWISKSSIVLKDNGHAKWF